MTIAELYVKLNESGIPESRYYLHGLYGSMDDEDKLALTIRRGKNTVEYVVFFKERGERHIIRVFTTEDEACQYIFERLIENKKIEDRYSK